MTIHHTYENQKVTVRLDGELGHHEAIGIMSRVGEILDVHLPREVVLDLSTLSFMDSSGIAVVLQSARRCRDIGASFLVQGTPKQAMRVLQAAGVPKLVTFR